MGRTTQKGHRQPGGATSLEALKIEVKEGQRVPFYLLHGDEEFDRDETCDWLIAALQPNAAMEFNIDVFRGDDLAALNVFRGILGQTSNLRESEVGCNTQSLSSAP